MTDNFPKSEPARDITLLPMGGGGSQTRFDQRYWVAPLPPPGPLGGTRVDLDGAAVVAAAAEADALWE